MTDGQRAELARRELRLLAERLRLLAHELGMGFAMVSADTCDGSDYVQGMAYPPCSDRPFASFDELRDQDTGEVIEPWKG